MTTPKQVKAGITFCRFKTKGAIKQTLLLLGSACLLFMTITARGSAEPTAADILQGVRFNQGSQHRVLLAQLLAGGNNYPFRLVLNGPEMRYEFSNPEQILVVKMGDQGSRLEEITKGQSSKVSSTRLDSPVRGSDVTYEDISLRFLYWKNARIVGEDTIGPIRCYKLELHPDGPSQYGTVLAWVGKSVPVLAKAECYQRSGELSARISMHGTKTLPSDGTRIFQELRIERMKGGQRRDETPTRLLIKGEA